MTRVTALLKMALTATSLFFATVAVADPATFENFVPARHVANQNGNQILPLPSVAPVKEVKTPGFDSPFADHETTPMTPQDRARAELGEH